MRSGERGGYNWKTANILYGRELFSLLLYGELTNEIFRSLLDMRFIFNDNNYVVIISFDSWWRP
jgi:hypothetical protein